MKKSFIAGILLALFCISVYGQGSCEDHCAKKKKTTSSKQNDVPLACKAMSPEQMKRSEELKEVLFKKYDKLNESSDAVEFVYEDGKKYTSMLVEFISSERICCPFYTFDLKFFPNSEKIALTIGGSSKIKEMVKSTLN